MRDESQPLLPPQLTKHRIYFSVLCKGSDMMTLLAIVGVLIAVGLIYWYRHKIWPSSTIQSSTSPPQTSPAAGITVPADLLDDIWHVYLIDPWNPSRSTYMGWQKLEHVSPTRVYETWEGKFFGDFMKSSSGELKTILSGSQDSLVTQSQKGSIQTYTRTSTGWEGVGTGTSTTTGMPGDGSVRVILKKTQTSANTDTSRFKMYPQQTASGSDFVCHTATDDSILARCLFDCAGTTGCKGVTYSAPDKKCCVKSAIGNPSLVAGNLLFMEPPATTPPATTRTTPTSVTR